MMGYAPPVFPSSPRIARACKLAGGRRTGMTTAIQAVTTLISLHGRLCTTPTQKFMLSGEIPRSFSSQTLPFTSTTNTAINVKVTDYDKLHSIALSDLEQFKDDLTIVNDYWKFADGFMTRVAAADVAAVKAVTGL